MERNWMTERLRGLAARLKVAPAEESDRARGDGSKRAGGRCRSHLAAFKGRWTSGGGVAPAYGGQRGAAPSRGACSGNYRVRHLGGRARGYRHRRYHRVSRQGKRVVGSDFLWYQQLVGDGARGLARERASTSSRLGGPRSAVRLGNRPVICVCEKRVRG